MDIIFDRGTVRDCMLTVEMRSFVLARLCDTLWAYLIAPEASTDFACWCCRVLCGVVLRCLRAGGRSGRGVLPPLSHGPPGHYYLFEIVFDLRTVTVRTVMLF